jgi:NAD(P)-dependent dehydrogenase (short-subunit alcohol dehydrogenase family)
MYTEIFRLDGKVAVVTGAGSGLGRSFAVGLADFGARVICSDVNLAGAEHTVTLLQQNGGVGHAIRVDVADAVSVETMWSEVRAVAGSVHILVNNAGISTAATRTHEMRVDDWDRLMAINLRGVFLNTKHALPLMMGDGGGSIINVSSIAGLRGYYPGSPGLMSNYSASKAGIDGFTRQVAAEYARDDIRVNAIAPGWHGGTALAAERRAMSSDEAAHFDAELLRRIPVGRRGVPDDLIGLCVYLASDASRYVTGQVIAHDGGWDGMVA